MTKNAIKESMLRLPPEDRLELMENLEISLARDEQRIPLQPWQRELIESRRAEYKKDPTNVIRGEDFIAKLRETAARMREKKS